MKLIEDWRKVTSRSLSFWMQIFGLLVLILPELMYRVTGIDYDPFVAWWLGILLLLAGIVGRLIQQNLTPWREWLRLVAVAVVAVALALTLATQVRAAPATEAETLGIAVPFVGKWEGTSLVAYRDIVGVWTICKGHVEGVHAGMTMTARQCDDLLRKDLVDYRARLHAYFTPDTIQSRLPPTRDAAYTSLAYNCGVPGIGKSTATRRLNAGDIVGGCAAMTWWNKAGGRVVRGLFLRRGEESALCLIGAE